MKNKKVIITSIIIAALLAGYVKGCAYLPITGTVVDAETGKPIEGAVVLVEWTIKKGIGDKHTESVKVAEVLTDKDGKFDLPGCYRSFVEKPDLAVYKKGFVTWSSRNIFPTWENRKDFQWASNNRYMLEKFKTTYSYTDHYMFTTGAINSTIDSERKQLFFKMYSVAEEDKVIKEQNEKDQKRMKGQTK